MRLARYARATTLTIGILGLAIASGARGQERLPPPVVEEIEAQLVRHRSTLAGISRPVRGRRPPRAPPTSRYSREAS